MNGEVIGRFDVLAPSEVNRQSAGWLLILGILTVIGGLAVLGASAAVTIMV